MILLTGATGYIGGRLVPELLAAGHTVRCLARNPGKLEDASWSDRVEVVAGDVRVHADLGRDGRRGDAVGPAEVTGEQVDLATRRIAEGVGDRRDRCGERRGRIPVPRRLADRGRLGHPGILPIAVVQIPRRGLRPPHERRGSR